MIWVFIVSFILVEVFLLVKINACLERVEENLVDIEVTYIRMQNVLTYLRDCINQSGNK